MCVCAAVDDDDESVPISIPIEVEIEVTILNDTDEDELYEDTKALLQHLDLSKVKDMKKEQSEGEQQKGGANRKLRQVRKGYEFRGMDITVSKKLSEDPGT